MRGEIIVCLAATAAMVLTIIGRELWRSFLAFSEQRYNDVYGEGRTSARNSCGESASERQSSFALTQHLGSVSDPERMG